MSIDADEIFRAVAEGCDGKIDRSALDALFVVEKDDPRILSSDLLDDRPGSVGAAAVGNDDPGAKPIGRRSKLLKQRADMGRFVEARNHDQA